MKPRQPNLQSGRCSPGRVTLGAQREVKKAAKPSCPSEYTSGKEGRVTLRKMEVKKRGFGPLAEWLKAKETGDKGFRRVEEEKGTKDHSRNLDQKVRDIRDMYEVAGETKGSLKEDVKGEKQDPELGLDPGGSNGTIGGHRIDRKP